MKITGFTLLGMAIIILFVSIGCRNNTTGRGAIVANDTARFFPVNEYIRDQIAKVAGNAVFIYKITIRNGRKDSVVLSKQQFSQLAQAFLEYDINDKSIHKYYRENTFMDESTHSYTFYYTAANGSLPLQSQDILLSTDDRQVSRVFLTKVKTDGENTITEKAGWKNNESFYINRIIENTAGETTEQNIIVWRNQP